MENIEVYPLTVAMVYRCEYLTKCYMNCGYDGYSPETAKKQCIEELQNAIMLLKSSGENKIPYITNLPKVDPPQKKTKYDICCPDCNSNNISKNGKRKYKRGVQEYSLQGYICNECGKRFQ